MPSIMSPEMIAEELGRTGLCICPDFLSQQTLRETQADFNLIHDANEFYRAGTGQGEQKQVRDLVRRDEIHWLDRKAQTPSQTVLWEKLDSLMPAFNRFLYLGLGELQGHYASYAEGGYYRRHLDCFKNDNSRIVSVILYLNKDWRPSDGGELRIHHTDKTYVDVAPIGGTMLCFLSREIEHEVLLCHSPRMSFAGWFTNCPP